MVMEAVQRRPLRHGVKLELRSREDLSVVGQVVDICAAHGVKHRTFLREALRLAVGDARVLEAAKRADLDNLARVRRACRDRMRWYRNRSLV